MNIELHEISVSDLVKDYYDDGDGGVRGYGGRLDIRPPHQREFVYKDQQRDAVIDTILKGFPLNVMYWAERNDGTYEIIDGQQRTISICQYVTGVFSVEKLAFHNRPADIQKQIRDYILMVYFCEGTDSEKLNWFKTINIAGVKLKPQELRNAVYSGSWVSDAKRYFSRRSNPASQIGSDYLSGEANRQEYMETAIKWINNGDVDGYMSDHQHDPNARELWEYFESVIHWVRTTFPKKRTKFTKQVDWGELYQEYKDSNLDPVNLEAEVFRLMMDDEIKKKSGIYPYVLTLDKSHLNLRVFSAAQKQKAFERQKGVCPMCSEEFDIENMAGDHIVAWIHGGQTIDENCQMLCRRCNGQKGAK